MNRPDRLDRNPDIKPADRPAIDAMRGAALAAGTLAALSACGHATLWIWAAL